MTRTKTRALANWPNNAVSILDFGAMGDGVTDDSTALELALTWLFSGTKANKSLYVPSGVYNLDKLVQLSISPDSSQFTIYGDGATSVFHCKDPNGGIKINTASNAVYLTIDGLQFCPGEGNGETAFALWFTYDLPNVKNRHSVWMRNCVVDTLTRDNFNDGWVDVFKLHGVHRLKIQDTTIFNQYRPLDANGNTIGKMLDLEDCYKPWIENIYCNGKNQYGIYNLKNDFNEGGTFLNCNIVGPLIGILIKQNPADMRHPEVWIKNSHMNCEQINIDIYGSKYIWIVDNLLYGGPSEYNMPGSPKFIDIQCTDCYGVNIDGNIFGTYSFEEYDRRHVKLNGSNAKSINVTNSQLDARCTVPPFFFGAEASDITFHQQTPPLNMSYYRDKDGQGTAVPENLIQGNATNSVFVYRYDVWNRTLG